ncbi:ATP-binding protein [Caulobacter sp. KR2-114]|uniref:ATP-binding protein n=1 Tax=Caulobacter sp. KR2-114 TaxID=3400912 RepID=UPI003BFDBFC9
MALLDSRYRAVGAESYRMAPLRLCTAAAAAVVLCAAVGWRQAATWAGLLGAFEIWGLISSRPLDRRPDAGRGWLVSFFWANMGMSLLWSGVGVLLWLSDRPACHMAAIAFWAGHMIYAQYFYLKSRASLVQTALITGVMPIALPLLVPRFQGGDQLILMSVLLLCVGHAVNGAIMNIRSARALEAAQTRLTEAKEQAEAASRAKSDFLAIMSHEIRTPLNGVLGMTQAMAFDELNPTQRARLEVVRQSGEALSAIVNDVLDLSKIEAGKLSLETIAFDLGAVMRDAHTAYGALAAGKGLSFELRTETAEGVYLGDPTRVRQILYNLISNALKFTESGAITVSARRLSVGVMLEVADTGVGIAPDALPDLFLKFTQADVSTTRRYGGTGLGLSICRQLAEMMGGSIRVESREGEGSRFIVTLALPRAGDAPAPAEMAEAAPVQDPGRPLRILAAEDNAVNRLVLKTLLEQVGLEAVTVENGALALAAWETEPWDLILMDVQMPVMDGPDAARAIRAAEARDGRGRTPILALTANAMAHQIASYLAAGMDGHVAKPIEAQALFAAIARAVEPDEAAQEPTANNARHA